MTSDKFIGYLVSVECKNVFYQGIVTNIDSNKALIQLKNCFQNGLHCGNKLIEIKTFEIDNIEILADPHNAFNILKPKIQSATTNNTNFNLNKNEIISDNNLNGSDGSNKNNTSSSSTSSTSSSSIEKKSSLSESHYNNAKVNVKTVNVNTNLNQNMSKRISNNNMANNYNESIKTRQKNLNNGHHNHNGHSNNSTNNFSNNNNNHRNRRHNSNEAFFGSDSNDNDEFDFEQNLALFDKNAFYEEVEGHSRPSDDNEESSNAFDSVLKHISLTQTSSNHQLNEFNGRKHDTDTHQTTSAVIYHPISVANLFSSSNNLKLKSNDTKSGITTSSNSTTSIPLSSILPSLNGGVQQQQQGKNGNYRFDEMILDTGEPINMQQIKVPFMNTKKNYVTDDGFIVPCIDYSLREMIFEQAYKQGFNKQRQIECMGRCCAEMALQLVGGPLRFSPKNNHQKPSILVLANSQHIQGVYALCTARLLSTRNVKIYLFVYNNTKTKIEQKDSCELDAFFKNELNLFLSTDAVNYKLLNSANELKNVNSIDLILNGLESPESSKLFTDNQLISYIENCKASVVSIDPPVAGSVIKSKWCITPVLPMAMSIDCGRVYLCDLGFTKNMFQSVNIKYQSPFGAKFLIPLHND